MPIDEPTPPGMNHGCNTFVVVGGRDSASTHGVFGATVVSGYSASREMGATERSPPLNREGVDNDDNVLSPSAAFRMQQAAYESIA
jgi:hypothetical protein